MIGSTNDPDQELISIFGMDSNSSQFAVRYAFAIQYMENLLDFLGVQASTVSAWLKSATTLSSSALGAMGIDNMSPPILGLVLVDQSYSMHIPPVYDEAVANQQLPTGQNYLTWLAGASIDDLRTEKTGWKSPPYSLLYKVLRASLLRAYSDTAFQLLLPTGQVSATDQVEPVLLNMDPSNPTPTVWTRFNMKVPSSSGPIAVSSYLENAANRTTTIATPLNETLLALESLATLTMGELTYLFSGTLDSCSHRLDSLVTSLANQRLLEIRKAEQSTNQKQPSICIGAYAWVENLPPHSKTPSNPLAGTSGLAYDQVGYIHAPSLPQAAAAALLRNAYVSGADPNNNFSAAIDLSSDRVRRALLLLEGIRQGSSISMLLGSWFERDLHESNPPLDVYIQPFRELYPLAPSNPTNAPTPVETVTPRDVVDGYALEQAWINNSIPFGSNNLPSQTTNLSHYNDIVKALKDIVGIMDSVNDISVAESGYQFARGNYSAATGIMDAISQGKRPPVPQIVDSPHTGIALTNRFVLALSPTDISLPPNWPDPISTNNPRAQAEPLLNAWVGLALGDPTQVGCTVTTTSVDPSIDGIPQIVTLADLQLQPLDVLYLGVSDGTPRAGELEQRIAYYVLASFAVAINNKSTATITFNPAPTTTTTTFPQLLELASAIRQTINTSRPLAANDLEPLANVQSPSDVSIDMTDSENLGLSNRESIVEGLVQGSMNNLNAQLKLAGVDPSDSPLDRQRDLLTLSNQLSATGGPPTSVLAVIGTLPALLVTASMLGGKGSIPVNSNGLPQQDPIQLVKQALTVYDDLNGRYNKVTKARSALSTGSSPDASTLISWIQMLLSKDFAVLPLFTPDASTFSQLQSSLASTNLVTDSMAPILWFEQVSHVRDHLRDYGSAATYAEIMGTNLSLQFKIAQLPYTATDTWAALSSTNKSPMAAGLLSLVFAQPSSAMTSGEKISGLVIDDWTEFVANKTETTGVAYHYDDPNSQAPQTMLLALAPASMDTWQLDYLISLLSDTFDLAKIRCVDPDQNGFRNQFLPAMMFSDNLQGQTVRTRLRGHKFE